MQEPNTEPSVGFVYYVDDASQFKARNLGEWKRNADFWLQGKMRHLSDLYDTVVVALRQLLDASSPPDGDRLVIDAGCGNGWAIRALDDAHYAGRYV
jgi:hypothetical protein